MVLTNTGEIANLLHFSPDFQLPAHLSTKTYYQLLGNSINVRVVANLMQYLLLEPQD